MKKRILALFLAAIMILSLAACGSKPAEETQQSTEPQQTGDTVAATEGNQEEEPVLLRIWFLEHYGAARALARGKTAGALCTTNTAITTPTV